MEYRTLGRTGLRVSAVALGCEGFMHKRAEEVKADFDFAIGHGINFVDIYSSNPDLRADIGAALEGRRGEFIIQGHLCTVWENDQYLRTRDPQKSADSFERQLRQLRTDYLDVGMIHYVDAEADLRTVFDGPIIRLAQRLKAEGRIRSIGLSSHNPAVARMAVETGLVDVLMFSINPAYDLQPASENVDTLWADESYARTLHNVDPERERLYELCERTGVGIRTDLQAAYGSYNTLQTELSNRIRKGRFTSVVTGSYNRTDGHRADMGFEQYGGYAKLGYELSRAWTLSGDVNLTHFNASNPGEVTAPLIDNDSRITRGRASAALANRYDRTSGALSLFYNWGRHKIDDGYAAGSEPLDYRFNSRDRMLGVSWYQSAQLFAGNRLTVGFDYFHFGGESWNRFLDGHEEPQVDKTQDEVAGYVDFRQSLGTWLTLDAGLRVDRHSHVGTEWVPQAGVSFHLPRSAEIKLSAGKGFRYPTIRELYMFRPANPDLRPERLWSYELSLSQRLWEGRLSYGVNLFYIDGENLILRMPVDGRQMNVNTGRIENAGVEAEIAYRISAAWSVDANYSFLHMEHPVLAAPEHKLHVGASFTQGRWSVSTGLQYVEGLYTSIVVGGTGSDAQENFILWNLRAGFRISRKLRIFVDGENLLAQRYEINAGFPMPRATVLGGLDMHF